MSQPFLSVQLYRQNAQKSHKSVISPFESFWEKLAPELQDSVTFGLASSDDYSAGAILCRAIVEQDETVFNYFDLTKLSVEELDDMAILLFSRRKDSPRFLTFAMKLLPYLDINNKIHLLSYLSQKADWEHFNKVDATLTEKDDLPGLEMDKLKYFVRDGHLERATNLTKKIIADVSQEALDQVYINAEPEDLEYLNSLEITSETYIDEELLQNLRSGTIEFNMLTKLEQTLKQEQNNYLFEVVQHMGVYGLDYNNVTYLEILMDQFDENYVDEITEFVDALIIPAALNNQSTVTNFFLQYCSDFINDVAMAIMAIHENNFASFKEIFDKLTSKQVPSHIMIVFMNCVLHSPNFQFIERVNESYNFIEAMIVDEKHKNHIRMSLPVIKWINQKFPEYELHLIDIFNAIEDDEVWLEYLEYFHTTNQLNNSYDVLNILSGYMLQRHATEQNLSTVQKLLALLSHFDAKYFESTLHQLGSIWSTKNRNAVIIDYLITHIIDIKIPEELAMAVACYDSNRRLFLRMLHKISDASVLEKLANNLARQGYYNLNQITLMYWRKM